MHLTIFELFLKEQQNLDYNILMEGKYKFFVHYNVTL